LAALIETLGKSLLLVNAYIIDFQVLYQATVAKCMTTFEDEKFSVLIADSTLSPVLSAEAIL